MSTGVARSGRTKWQSSGTHVKTYKNRQAAPKVTHIRKHRGAMGNIFICVYGKIALDGLDSNADTDKQENVIAAYV